MNDVWLALIAAALCFVAAYCSERIQNSDAYLIGFILSVAGAAATAFYFVLSNI